MTLPLRDPCITDDAKRIEAVREMFPRCLWCGLTILDGQPIVLVELARGPRVRHAGSCVVAA